MLEADPFEDDYITQRRDLFWFLTCIRAWRTNPWLPATLLLIIIGSISTLIATQALGPAASFAERVALGVGVALPFVVTRAFMQILGGGSATKLQVATAADLACCDLSRQDLTDLQIRGRDLTSARLTRCNLLAADLMGSLMLDVDLSRSIARRARFDYADMTEAIGHRTDLRDASLVGTNLTDGLFERADFRGAQLIDATLMNCDLRRAAFSTANLHGADLRGADLRGADLRHCVLRSVSLQGADLRGARLEGADLDGIKVDDLTIWPDGDAKLFGSFELSEDDLELLSTPPD
ncbi:MAG: pentapeptide repeat-containing protein [Acidimicrobiales bacterium]